MKGGFYLRLAADGIRKNRRIYFPYILMCVALIAMYYIIAFLRFTDTISDITGVGTIRFTLNLGGWVLAVFSCAVLFYANAFLTRSRRKEFGLYNIFGMDKGNIGKVIARETAIVAVISVCAGVILGIACSKFAELGLVRIIGAESNYRLKIEPRAVGMTAAVYTVVFILQLMNTQRKIGASTSVSLLQSEHVGERPPKANAVLGISGAILLILGYFIAVTVSFPSARKLLAAAFIAVLLVIAGTYITMVAGSVLLCRVLQRNRSYYYKPAHFVSVSSMAFRMKRGGVGLASICILITMVLVMISSTACLLYGTRFEFYMDYPREMTLDFVTSDPDVLDEENLTEFREAVLTGLDSRGVAPENVYDMRFAEAVSSGATWDFYFFPLEDHNGQVGTEAALNPGEALVFTFGNDFEEDAVRFKGMEWKVVGEADGFCYAGRVSMDVSDSTVAVIIPDFEELIRAVAGMPGFGESFFATFNWAYNFDTGLPADGQLELYEDIRIYLDDLSREYGFMGLNCDSRENAGGGEFSMYGGIFFLGIVLSIVFVLAAVLIIYYKQLTEGFEDRPRFETMRKIGMTGSEIRKSINSQMLTVFFFPLLLALAHLVFAFPLIQKLLLVFKLSNEPLFLRVTVIVGAFVAGLYAVVYRATSNTYYSLVSGGGKEK